MDNSVCFEKFKDYLTNVKKASSNTLSSLPWAEPFGREEVEKFLRQGRDILEWYDGMRRLVPSWYSKEA